MEGRRGVSLSAGLPTSNADREREVLNRHYIWPWEQIKRNIILFYYYFFFWLKDEAHEEVETFLFTLSSTVSVSIFFRRRRSRYMCVG